jgi:hypothetical protein
MYVVEVPGKCVPIAREFITMRECLGRKDCLHSWTCETTTVGAGRREAFTQPRSSSST